MARYKILFVTSNDIAQNTSGNIRNVSLIKGLKKIGCDIQIICMYHGKKRDKRLLEVLDDVNIYCLNPINEKPNAVTFGGTSNNRVIKKLRSIAVKGYEKIRIFDQYKHKIKHTTIEKNRIIPPDIIISSSDPRSSHVLAEKIIKTINFKKRYVQYWGDPMALDIYSPKYLKPWLEKKEKELLLKSDLIIYTNSLVAERISEMYDIPRDKIKYIPTSNVLINNGRTSEANDGIGPIKVAYIGEFRKRTRNLHPLINGVIGRNDIILYLIGHTDYDVPNEKNIIHFDQMSPGEVAEIQNQMDILIAIENLPKDKVNNLCLQIPGKVYHYGLSNKRILIIEETGICRREFEALSRYYFCKNNEREIIDTIKSLYDESSDTYFKPAENFMPLNVAKELIGYVEELNDEIIPIV